MKMLINTRDASVSLAAELMIAVCCICVAGTATIGFAADESASQHQEEEPTENQANWDADERSAETETEQLGWQLPVGIHPTTAINLLVEMGWHERNIKPSPPCDDRTFVRRVFLDLIGRIPTPHEAQEFLQDTNSTKRDVLVDRLLHSHEFARYFSEIFDAILLGRTSPQRYRARNDSHWIGYLDTAFRENRPWDEVAAAVLLARPKNKGERGATWFLYEQNNKHQQIAEAISAGFFGVKIDCAQCHDHPLAYEIEQQHYWGLVAFYQRSENYKKNGKYLVKESAEGGFSKFTNALTGEALDTELTFLGSELVIDDPTRPLEQETDVDNGDQDQAEQDPDIPDDVPSDNDESSGNSEAEGDESESTKNPPPPQYHTADENGNPLDPPIPVFSRREQFVERIVRGNPLIARAAVNRIWALLMGRGISHPVDRMNSNYEPSHPLLLDWLAGDFAAHNYNVKRLLRSIVLSRPYALQAQPVGRADDAAAFAWALAKPLTAEALYRSMLIVADGNVDQADAGTLNAFQQQFSEVTPEEAIATLKQTLFLSNNDAIQSVFEPRSEGNFLRLARSTNDKQVVRSAFELAFGRLPDQDELHACTVYLADRTDRRNEAIGQMFWALLNSAEFQFNH